MSSIITKIFLKVAALFTFNLLPNSSMKHKNLFKKLVCFQLLEVHWEPFSKVHSYMVFHWCKYWLALCSLGKVDQAIYASNQRCHYLPLLALLCKDSQRGDTFASSHLVLSLITYKLNYCECILWGVESLFDGVALNHPYSYFKQNHFNLILTLL